MKKRCANSALPLARIGKQGPPAEGKRIEHSESHKMQLEQLKKNVGRHFRIRPITERWDDTGQLDSRDDRWSLDNVDVKANHIKITNLSTGYSKEIGGDNVREYRSPDFLILHCQLIIRGNTLLIQPILRPKTILSEEQECLSRIVAGYQRQFKSHKLINRRDGTATFPPQNGATTLRLNCSVPKSPKHAVQWISK